MSMWTLGWLGFFAYFIILEGFALARSARGDTLSEHVWLWFGVGRHGEDRPKGRTVQLRRFVLLAFCAWLPLHFLTGGWV